MKKKFKKNIELLKKHGFHWYSLFVARRCVAKISPRLTKRIEKRMMRLEREARPAVDPDALQPITHTEFIRFEESDRYYRGRWSYLGKVTDMINKIAPHSALEIGAHRFSVVHGSDIMDISNALPNIAYRHDATQTPWPVKDKAYDLFLALQVWEHLGDKQSEAFAEVMRVSRAAILSFPYKWDKPGNCHHNIDEHTIERWTLGVAPRRVEMAKGRIIYFFNFDDSEASAGEQPKAA